VVCLHVVWEVRVVWAELHVVWEVRMVVLCLHVAWEVRVVWAECVLVSKGVCVWWWFCWGVVGGECVCVHAHTHTHT
jgi:hypothetical protein